MQIPYRKPGKFSQIKPDPLLTQEKFHEVERELKKLKRIQPQAAAEVARLAELGDFSENAEYQLAKGRLRGINNAILRVENQLNRAVIIAPPRKGDVVSLGHTVTIERDGKRQTYQILGSTETNPQKGIISHNSPIGAGLMGHSVGETVKIVLANKEVEFLIVKVE